MSYLIRGGVLSGAVDLIADLGGDPDELLAARGLTREVTEDTEQFISYRDAAGVFGDAARLLDCPDFGLRLARRQGIEILGPLSVILRHAETVGEAIDGACRFLHNIVLADTATLTRTPPTAVYSFDTIIRNEFDRYQMVEKSLALAMDAFCMMLGEDFVPVKVTFRHSRIAPLECYHEVFRSPVEFDADENSVHLPLAVLRRSLPERDAAAIALAESFLTRVKPDLAVADHVGEVTRRLLVVGQASLVEAARAVGLHPRVLQRRLAEEGTTFEQILDGIRRALAWELAATGTQISQIAQVLGYSEQSSFARACRRWYGQSPRQLRARRRGELPSSPPPPFDATRQAASVAS